MMCFYISRRKTCLRIRWNQFYISIIKCFGENELIPRMVWFLHLVPKIQVKPSKLHANVKSFKKFNIAVKIMGCLTNNKKNTNFGEKQLR